MDKIEVYQNGVIHRAGDKEELYICHERKKDDVRNTTNRMEVWLRPAGSAGVHNAKLVTHISCHQKYNNEYLRTLYTDLTGAVEEDLEVLQEQYLEMLRKHDWYYEYSDSNAVYEAGSRARDKILEMARKVDPDYTIYNEHKKG